MPSLVQVGSNSTESLELDPVTFLIILPALIILIVGLFAVLAFFGLLIAMAIEGAVSN